MKQRTWPFGTRKKVTVHHVSVYRHEGEETRAVFVTEPETREFFILAGKNWPGAQQGNTGTIIFKECDPNRGRWQFEQQQPSQPGA